MVQCPNGKISTMTLDEDGFFVQPSESAENLFSRLKITDDIAKSVLVLIVII